MLDILFPAVTKTHNVLDFDIKICQKVQNISVFSFFYIYLLVFNSSVYIYLTCKDVFFHLSDFFKSSKIAKTRNYPYPLPESDSILEFSSHVSHFVFNVVFVRYDFTRIYTLFVSDFLYKASG